MSAPLQPFYFPPPVDIDRRALQENAEAIAGELATQPDLVPIRQQATNTAIQLQQQQQNQNAGTGGLNKLLTFSGSLSTTDWTTTDGVLRVDGNQLTMNPNVANGCYLVRTNYVFTTDDQAIFFQLGTEATTDVYTYGILRANNLGEVGVACRVSANSIAIGTVAFTGSGGSAGFVAAASVSRGQATGDSVEFRAVGDSFVVLVNGNPACSFSGALGSKGSSWRGASVIKQRAQPFFVSYSFNLYSFGMYDFGAVGTAVGNRVAAKISRIAVSEVGIGGNNGSAQLLPSNFFSVIDFAQGMTVLDVNTAKIRIDKANWYLVTVGLAVKYDGISSDLWQPPFFCIYRTPTGSSTAQILHPGTPGGVSVPVALAEGDVVQPGVVNFGSAVFPAGSGDAAYSQSVANGLVSIGGPQGAYFQVIADA